MEKKTIFLELPSDIVDRIDRQNDCGDRSSFITGLLNKQLDEMVTSMDVTTELTSSMTKDAMASGIPGEIKLMDNRGIPLGKFNINTVEGFERLSSKICEVSDDPIVRMKARKWR
jgi:hypothetical protein